jgi:type VI secretion system VgrG family protein
MSIQTRFYFQSRASSLVKDTFRVIRFHGQEEISQPFRFEIELVSDNADIDPDEVLQWPAFLTIERDGKRRMVHGVLAEFEQQHETSLDLHFYRAVLVPRLWLLSMSQQNQIYQDKSVPEIVEEELKGSKDKGPAGLAAANLTTEDFELRLTRKYQKREYVVQYGESDLNFISRLMEHEGLFYFFEHDDEKEKIIITDDNIHFPAIAEESSIPYHSPSGMVIADEESVRALSCRHRRMPKKLILKDYNYRTPHVPLQGEANVDGKGHGLISEYGNHFKTPEEGVSLAKIRAEEIRCHHAVFRGEGDCSLFLPGHRCTLEGHFRKDFNREYVITGVEHDGTQPVAGASGLANDGAEQLTYRNTFTAIASDVPFRPERKTPKPRMYGIMNAHVDAALLKDRAEIDDQGRYKVVMPFDLSGSGEGKASRFVRMAQPYGGGSHGMHFPLHKDVEVIWACIDGDPDRPIIVGTVPNPLNPSVVTAGNSTKNVIKTASGSFLEFNDGPGPGGMVQKTGGPQLQRQQQYQYDTHDAESAVYEPHAVADSNREETEDYGQREDPFVTPTDKQNANYQGKLEEQHQKETYDTVEEAGNDKWFRVKVPNYAGKKDSYLRLGKDPTDENTTAIIDPEKLPDNPEAGWFDYTDGVHTSISGPTVPETAADIYDRTTDPIATRAVPPDIDDALKVSYGINADPPSTYDKYSLGTDFWKPAPSETEVQKVMSNKGTRYFPYWDKKASKRQEYDAGKNQWNFSYDVKKDDRIRGSHSEHVQGDRITQIEGTWDCTIKGHLYNTTWGHVHSDYYQSHSESYYDDVLDVYGQPSPNNDKSRNVTVTEIAYGDKYEWHFGNKIEVVEGTIYEHHQGGKDTFIEKDGKKITEEFFTGEGGKPDVHVTIGDWPLSSHVNWHEDYHGSKEERYWGAQSAMVMGNKNDFFLGPLAIDAFVGGKLETFLSVVISLGFGASIDIKKVFAYEKTSAGFNSSDILLNNRIIEIATRNLKVGNDNLIIHT